MSCSDFIATHCTVMAYTYGSVGDQLKPNAFMHDHF